MRELTDAEFSLLLTLDAEVFLWELLKPIVRHEGRREFLDRPSLSVPDAADALTSLVARGLADVVVTPPGVYDIDAGRVLGVDELRAVLADPASWEAPERGDVYHAVPTPAAEEAYAVASALRVRGDG
jgi:hypothetical protein